MVKLYEVVDNLVMIPWNGVVCVTCLEWNILTNLIKFQSSTPPSEVSIKRDVHFRKERRLIWYHIVFCVQGMLCNAFKLAVPLIYLLLGVDDYASLYWRYFKS